MPKPRKSRATKQFKKDFKRIKRRGWDIDHLKRVMAQIINGESLASTYGAHTLKGALKSYQECHIEPDFLLLWTEEAGVVAFARTGTHADIFGE